MYFNVLPGSRSESAWTRVHYQIRIRIRSKSWFRIRIKSMRFLNTGSNKLYDGLSWSFFELVVITYSTGTNKLFKLIDLFYISLYKINTRYRWRVSDKSFVFWFLVPYYVAVLYIFWFRTRNQSNANRICASVTKQAVSYNLYELLE
jgi:hypothetical protein